MTVARVKVCEWCGGSFVGRGRRFCGKAHATAWQNAHAPDAERRLQALQEGHHRYRADVQRVKVERGLLDVDELLKRLRRASVPKSSGAISGHIRDGLLEPERGLGFDKPYLFAEAAVDAYVEHLRGYKDGRLRRFKRTAWRLEWIQLRHGTDARIKESGRLNTALAAAKGKRVGRPTELDEDVVAEIRDMASRCPQLSHRAIAQNVSRKVAARVTHQQVGRVLGSAPGRSPEQLVDDEQLALEPPS